MITTADRTVNLQATWHEEIEWLSSAAKTRRRRSMREFAEDEITIPTGRWEGRRFRAERQPYVARFFDLLTDNRWNEVACVGPSQSGKSLNMFVLPILYHLFECRESVIAGVVDMDKMAKDKWERDLLPVIERTRYRELIPSQGRGSRGGFGDTMAFKNGAVLKWMSGGGSDKTRAYFTSRIVCFTEIDELAVSQETSLEADKIKQIEARTRSYGRQRRVYKECTVTTEDGHIWSRYKAGTASRIMLPCPHCKTFVALERDDLVGWKEAESDVQAENGAAFQCSACKQTWTEEQRSTANHKCRVLHKGQAINRAGRITGDMPETRTLGFRWSGVNNLFLEARDFGGDMWKSQHEPDQDNAERERSQFIWATPYSMPGISITAPDERKLRHRTRLNEPAWRRGIIPPGTNSVTVGIDIGKRLGHWTVIAFMEDRTIQVCDYGVFEIKSEYIGVHDGVLEALQTFRDDLDAGWHKADGGIRRPDQVWVDANWQKEERGQADPIYDFMRDGTTNYDYWKPTLGRSRSQLKNRKYSHPSQITKATRYIGEQFYIKWVGTEALFIVEVNVDYWKTRVHERLMLAPGEPGAAMLFSSPDVNEHISFSKHITAEELVETNEPGKGVDIKWQTIRRQNHWFDSTVLAMAAGSFCGYSPRDTDERIVPEVTEETVGEVA